MKSYLLILAFLPLMGACQKTDYPYSKIESEKFLNDITKNSKASITDITEIKKQPTDLFEIVTRYPLPKKKLDEYHKNSGTVRNEDDDISDFATFSFKGHELTNEKNKKLDFVDTGEFAYLQEYGLWKYDNVLHQNVGFELKVNGKFEKLKGFINVEFKMQDGTRKELTIPINISITDKIPE